MIVLKFKRYHVGDDEVLKQLRGSDLPIPLRGDAVSLDDGDASFYVDRVEYMYGGKVPEVWVWLK